MERGPSGWCRPTRFLLPGSTEHLLDDGVCVGYSVPVEELLGLDPLESLVLLVYDGIRVCDPEQEGVDLEQDVALSDIDRAQYRITACDIDLVRIFL